MSALRNYLNKIKPNFQKGGKLHAFESVFDGFESFLYVPNTTAKSGAHIHDAIDSVCIMWVTRTIRQPEHWQQPVSLRFSVSDSWLSFLSCSSATLWVSALSLPGHSGSTRKSRKAISSAVSSSH